MFKLTRRFRDVGYGLHWRKGRLLERAVYTSLQPDGGRATETGHPQGGNARMIQDHSLERYRFLQGAWGNGVVPLLEQHRCHLRDRVRGNGCSNPPGLEIAIQGEHPQSSNDNPANTIIQIESAITLQLEARQITNPADQLRVVRHVALSYRNLIETPIPLTGSSRLAGGAASNQ